MTEGDRTKWVAVFTTHIPEEAAIISGRLEDEGIPTVINGDTTRAFGMLMGRGARIEVMVDIADVLRAETLVNSDETTPDDEMTSADE